MFRINVRLSGRQKCHSVRLPWPRTGRLEDLTAKCHLLDNSVSFLSWLALSRAGWNRHLAGRGALPRVGGSVGASGYVVVSRAMVICYKHHAT